MGLSSFLRAVCAVLPILVVAPRANAGAGELFGAAAGDQTYVTVGAAGVILSSPDAVHWTNRNSPVTNVLLGASFGAGQFVVVGELGTILTSPDGTQWTRRTSTAEQDLRAVAFGNDRFVAVGSNGVVRTSPDGLTWTSSLTALTNPLNDVTFGGGLFVAVAGDGSPNTFGTIHTSPDGLTWTQRAATFATAFPGVAYGNGRFVALGMNGTVMTSTNGNDWNQTFGGPYSLTARLTFGNGRFVAATGGNPLVSTNGLSWYSYYVPEVQALNGVTFANGRFLAVGRDSYDQGLILVSTDGVRWGNVLAPLYVPIITSQPQSAELFAGQNWTFNVLAVANPEPTFQWRFNGNDLPGATEPELQFPSLTSTQSGDYSVVVGNELGAVTSVVAQLIVRLKAPEFITQPEDREAYIGGGTYLSAYADGGPAPTYRWYHNGVALTGQTNESLFLNDVSASRAGYYFLVASNALGVARSRLARVTVSPAVIFGQPESLFVNSGSSFYLFANVASAAQAGIRWFLNGTNLPGETSTVLQRVNVTTNQAGNYFFVVSNVYGVVMSAVAVVGVDRMAPYITRQPESRSVPAGQSTTFSVGAVGSPTLSLQWRKNGTSIAGALNFYFTPLATLSAAGNYDVVIRNSYGAVTSVVAVLTVNLAPPKFIYEPVHLTVSAGSYASFNASAEGSPPPTYQWYRNGVAIRGAIYSNYSFEANSADQVGDYTVVATNSQGSVTSRVARLVIYTVAPYFTSQPRDQSVRAGEYVYLQASAGGAPAPSYQWYFNGVALPGARNSYLNLPNATTNLSGNYSVVISNLAGVAVSRSAVVTVNLQAPTFVREPVSQTVPWGSSLGLDAYAVGGPPPQFQWFFNGVAIPGANSANLYFSPVTPTNAGNYFVVASNIVGVATSAVAVVTVSSQVPIFATQPSSGTALWGSYFSFFAYAEGAPPPSYQWLSNGVAIPGATSPSLTFYYVVPANAGSYRLVASNSVGVATSTVAVLTVNAQAPAFSQQPSSQTTLWGGSANFYAFASGGPPPTYQWLFNGVPLAGQNYSSLYLYNVTPTQAGNYRIVASNAVGVATSVVAVLTVTSQAPVFNAQPQSQSILWGESFFLYASAFGGPPPALQWRSNGVPIPHATNNYFSFPYATPAQAANYTAVASNIAGVTTSAVAVVTVSAEAPFFTSEPGDVAVLWGESLSLYASAVGGPPPTLQWFFNGAPIARATNNYVYFNYAVPAQAGNYSVVASNVVGVTTSAVAVVTVSAEAPFFTSEPSDATVLWGESFSLYASAAGGPPPTLQWLFNGAPIARETNNYLYVNYAVPAQAGNYSVVASNVVGVTTSAVAVVTINAEAPVFTSEPSDATVLWGESLSLYASAVGGPRPTLQWFFNGTPIARETNNYLYVNYAVPAQAGNYSVVASNVVGVVTSIVAVLTVNSQAPVFNQQPSSQTVLWGGGVSFSASARGGPPPTYQWLFNSVPLPGARHSNLYLEDISPAQAGNYAMVASNAVGVVTSSVAVLTVNSQAPVFYQQPFNQTVLWGANVNFYAAASGGPPPVYQWLFNDVPIPGQRSSSLYLAYVTPAQAGSYRLIASNAVGVATSVVAVLTVNSQAPIFTSQPASQTRLWGNSLTLYASAYGGPPPVLQWLFNDVPLPGETNTYLSFEYLTPAQAGNYSMMASNPIGVATSMVAVVTVLSQAPVFIHEPQDWTVLWGEPVDFYSYAEAGPQANYQWHFNDAPLPGETNSYLNIPYAGTNLAGLYYVVAANQFGSTTSRVATLSIEAAPPEFEQGPYDISALWGDNVTYSAFARGGPPPVYQWRFNGNPIPLATNSYLELFHVTTNHVGIYDVIASNYLGAVTSDAARLDVYVQAPEFDFAWPGGEVVEGTDVLLYAGAYGGPPPVLSVLFNGSPLALPYSAPGGFLLTEVTTNDSGAYTFMASNFVGSVTSPVAVLNVLPGGPLDRWARRNPRPQAENLLAITRGDGRFVATGERGSVIASTNGSNWISQRLRADADLAGVAYGNGLFVSVSRAGNILTSSNATQWLPRVFDQEFYLESVTFGNGRFVAVGGSGENVSLVSSNGIDWTRGAASVPERFMGVAWGNGRFVGVLASSPSILISSNGLDWFTTDTASSGNLENVAFGNGQFVAVGSNGAILTSPDGSTWTVRDSGETRRLIDVAYGNERWVVVGVRGIIRSSTDGVTWRAETSGTPDRLEGVSFAGGVFVTVGENGTTLSSTNGVAWTKQNLGSTRDLDGIASGRNGQIVTVGKFGTILTTPDGFHITERVSGTTNDLHGVAFANDLYVAVGDGGAIVTSSNGVAWTARSFLADNYYKSVAYGHGLWVAVGTDGVIISSTNGVDWLPRNSGLTKDLNEVAYGNGLFMIVGDDTPPNGTVLTSTDGATWINRSVNSGKNLRGLTFANGIFLVVANDGQIYVTSDGGSWQFRNSGVIGDGRNLRGATYAEGHWIVVGNDGLILTSTNTVTWQRRAPRTVENLHGVRYVNGTFVAIGNRGAILQSGRVIGPVLTVRQYDPQFGFVFSVEAEMNRVYRIQASSDLLNWTDILEFNNTQTTTLFVDEEALFVPVQFYRVVSP